MRKREREIRYLAAPPSPLEVSVFENVRRVFHVHIYLHLYESIGNYTVTIYVSSSKMHLW